GATQFYAAAVNTKTGAILAGAQDNGGLLYTGKPDCWALMVRGDGGYCVVDSGADRDGLYYGEYTNLDIVRGTGAAAGEAASISAGYGPGGKLRDLPYKLPEWARDG